MVSAWKSWSVCARPEDSAGDDAGGDEGSGFGAVNRFHQLSCGLLAFRLDVDDLTADHAGRKRARFADAGTDSERDLTQDGDGGSGRGGELREGLEGEGLESVAGENCHCLRRRRRGRWAGRGGDRHYRVRANHRG